MGKKVARKGAKQKELTSLLTLPPGAHAAIVGALRDSQPAELAACDLLSCRLAHPVLRAAVDATAVRGVTVSLQGADESAIGERPECLPLLLARREAATAITFCHGPLGPEPPQAETAAALLRALDEAAAACPPLPPNGSVRRVVSCPSTCMRCVAAQCPELSDLDVSVFESPAIPTDAAEALAALTRLTRLRLAVPPPPIENPPFEPPVFDAAELEADGVPPAVIEAMRPPPGWQWPPHLLGPPLRWRHDALGSEAPCCSSGGAYCAAGAGGASLAALGRLGRLRSLVLHAALEPAAARAALEADIIPRLTALTSLELVWAWEEPLQAEALAPLAPALRRLSISQRAFDPNAPPPPGFRHAPLGAQLECVGDAGLTKLTELRCALPRWAAAAAPEPAPLLAAGLSALAAPPALARLSLPAAALGQGELEALAAACPKLTRLCVLSLAAGAFCAAELPELKALRAGFPDAWDYSLSRLAPALTRLDVLKGGAPLELLRYWDADPGTMCFRRVTDLKNLRSLKLEALVEARPKHKELLGDLLARVPQEAYGSRRLESLALPLILPGAEAVGLALASGSCGGLRKLKMRLVTPGDGDVEAAVGAAAAGLRGLEVLVLDVDARECGDCGDGVFDDACLELLEAARGAGLRELRLRGVVRIARDEVCRAVRRAAARGRPLAVRMLGQERPPVEEA